MDIDLLPGLAAIIDGTRRYRCVNRAYAEWIGRPRAEIEGRLVAEVLPPEVHAQAAPLIERALRGEFVAEEIEIARPGCRSIHLECRYVPERDGDSDAPAVLTAFVSDISARRWLERRLTTKDSVTEALSRARTIAQAAPEVMKALAGLLGCRLSALWLRDADTHRLRCKSVHAPESALEGRFLEGCGKLEFEIGEGIVGHVWQSGERAYVPDVLEVPDFLRKDLAEAEGLRTLLVFPVALETEVVGVLEFFLEEAEPPHEDLFPMLSAITSQLAQFIERRRAEEALRESERHLAVLTDVVPQLIWSADSAGNVDFMSQRAQEYRGLARDDDGSWEWVPVVHPDDTEATLAAWNRAVQSGETYEIEHRIALADGDFRWHLTRALPLRNRRGEVTRWYGSATDIHSLKTAQTEAEGLLAERQAILETMTQGLAVIGKDAEITYLNPAGRRIFGLADEEPEANCGTDSFDPRDIDGKPLAPTELPESLAARGERVQGQMLRLTLRPEHEVILMYNAEPLKDTAGTARGAIVTFVDVTARHRSEQELRRSEAHLRATFEGVTDAILTLDTTGAVIDLNPAFASLHGFASVEEAKRPARYYSDTFEARTVDGTQVALADLPFRRAMSGEVVRNLELEVYRRRTGQLCFIGSYSAVPVCDEYGRVLQIVITIHDVTERRRAEQRHELLTREVNHRARNALAVVQAITRLTKAESIAEYGEAVRRRVATLVRSHSRLADENWHEVPLRALILDEVLPYAGETEDRVVVSGPEVHVAPEAVQPVSMALHELATNAAKHGAFSTPEGRVRVTISATADGAMRIDWAEEGGPPLPGPPSRRGVGSTVIQSVAAQLSGSAETRWNREGVRCLLSFGSGGKPGRPPDLSAEPRGSSRAPRKPGEDRPRILVVEDDALLAMDLSQTLHELGYEAIGPFSSVEAAGEHAAELQPLAAAVLDVNVGGVTTFALADTLQAREVPVLFTTGYANSDEIRSRGAEHVQKPFTTADLQQALRRVLS